MGQLFTDLQAVRLDVEANAVIILDQTSLPGEKVYLSLSTKEAVWDAIHRLKVRGAPAIGITAAYGIYVCCKSLRARKFDDFYKGLFRIVPSDGGEPVGSVGADGTVRTTQPGTARFQN